LIKKLSILLIIIACLFTISAVCAEDAGNSNNTNIGYESPTYTESSGECLKFIDLYNLINRADNGSTVLLENDYKFKNLEDIEGKGINITKEITIDGQGHTISGDYISRAFNVYANNVFLKNISFINCSNSYQGGAIIWYGENGNIINSHFERNTGGTGSSILWNGINGTVSDSYFNGHGITGGSIYWNNTGGAIINSIFTNNICDYGYTMGGAIYLNSNNTQIINSTFMNNYATNGGAIYGAGSDYIILNSKFFNNSAKDGGALYLKTPYYPSDIDNVLIYNSSFINNTATKFYGSGGALYCEVGKNNKIDSCYFANNSAFNFGGVIHWRGISNNTIINSIFDSNYATNGDSPVFLEGNYTSVINTKFTNNFLIREYVFSSASTGALQINGDNCIINNSSFINNTAADNCGALYLAGNNNLLINSNFINNSAIDIFKNDSDGGAAIITGENNEIDSCIFINNTADKGKAIRLYGDEKLIIKNSKFINCSDKINAIFKNEYAELINTTITNEGTYRIIAPELVKYYSGSERFTVTVIEREGKAATGVSISILLNGVQYDRVTDSNGVAGMNIGLPANNYTALVMFKGNDNYRPVNVTSKIVVKTTAYGSDLTKVEKAPGPYSATFLDSKGNKLTTGQAKFNINGILYYRDITNGVGKLNLNLEYGEYVITATNPVTGEMTSNKITITPRFTNNSDITKYYRNDTQYYITLIGDDGKPAGAGESVTFNINGVMYERQTNANGTTRMNINLNPGEYVITAIYKGCMISNKIKVLPIITAEDIVMKFQDGHKFEAKLVDGQGKPMVKENITFNINGVFYNRTTDVNGIARLNINLMAGEYIITSYYGTFATSNKITIRS